MPDRQPSLSDQQRLAWLHLIRTPGIGPALFWDLLDVHGSAETALDALHHVTKRSGTRIKTIHVDDVKREVDQAKRLGVHYVALGESGYPPTLAHIPRPPPVLSVRFNPKTWGPRPSIALVGARNASAGGRTLATRMAQDLSEAGYTVTSGLARGIDAAAHNGALATGTHAFLAGGLASIYPPEHEKLAQEIVENGGALYSEMPLNWQARAQDFPKRNRLVAGSSLTTIVIEAAKRSGSLITANQAADFGRLIMAVPGFPLDPRSEGPNALLRDGATLVRDAVDVIEEVKTQRVDHLLAELERFSPNSQDTGDQSQLFDSASETNSFDHCDDDVDRCLRDLLGLTPVSIDSLIETSQMPTHVVRAWLVENELTGRVLRSDRDLFGLNPNAN